jgi:transposase InsO family protein
VVSDDSEDKKMAIATFRFGVIADFVTGVRLEYGEKEKLIGEKTGRQYVIPYTGKSQITRGTIKKWISDYRAAGNRIEGLFPQSRKDKGTYRAIDATIQMAIKEIKRARPELTGVNIINELKHQKIISFIDEINLSVLYRFIEKEGLNDLKLPPKDARSFEASFPNEMWQSDVLHGPKVKAENKLQKSYLIAFLDDHSRLIPHAEFCLSENLAQFKDCLKKAVQKRGLPQKLYIDNGACYKALNLEQIAACLGIAIRHTPPYTPQGRGKIERWFRTVRDNFLNALPESKTRTLEDLNEELDNWIENYHNKIHSTTGDTPLGRYKKNLKCVRPAPNNLLDYFRFCEFRRVKKDRTFRLNGAIFEASVNLIDCQIEVRFHRETPTIVEIFFEGRSFGNAVILNRQVNFKIGRNNRPNAEPESSKIKSGEIFKGKKYE